MIQSRILWPAFGEAKYHFKSLGLMRNPDYNTLRAVIPEICGVASQQVKIKAR